MNSTECTTFPLFQTCEFVLPPNHIAKTWSIIIQILKMSINRLPSRQLVCVYQIVRGYLDSFGHSTIMIGFALLSILVDLFSLVRWTSATRKECLSAVRLHWSRPGQKLCGAATGHGKYEDVSQNSSVRSLLSHYSPYSHPFPPIPSPQHIPLCQHCRYSLNIHLKQQNWRVLTMSLPWSS